MNKPVIIGSGLAGLTAAWALAPTECVLATPGTLTDNAASMWAQGGIAAALADDDSPSLHAADTVRAGAFVGDTRTIRRITDAAPDVVALLADLGVPFDHTDDGRLDLALEGGHSRSRVAHAGDSSGAAITRTMAAAVRDLPSVHTLERHTARRLLTGPDGAISGVEVIDPDGCALVLETDAVVLATGGMGALWPCTTNPATALGQGVAMAARVGARTDDLHLVQFHPTALDVPAFPNPLLTEALRGAGAILTADGERFVHELQPRDVVAAAVWEQLQAGRSVRLDCREIPCVASRFAAVAELCAAHGFDITRDLLPVRPALHYSMGGVSVDAHARTSVPGLWAVGEVSRTGLHGANRLASNSLLEAVVTGRAAADSIRGADTRWTPRVLPVDPATVVPPSAGAAVDLGEVRAILGASCGVLRDGVSLEGAVDRLAELRHDDAGYVAWLVARSALLHPHTVGAHRRIDEQLETAAAQEVPA